MEVGGEGVTETANKGTGIPADPVFLPWPGWSGKTVSKAYL